MKTTYYSLYIASTNHLLKSVLIALILLVNMPVGIFAVPTHLKIFLIGGQSNAVGLGENSDLPLEYKGVQTNVKSYTSYKCSDAVNSDKWLHVAPGVCDFSTKHGCELSLAKKLSLLYPNDSIAIIKCALGSTTLATQWRSPSLEGPTDTDPNFHMYQIFMNTVNTALSKLGSAYTYEIAGMVWMQGENDGIQNDWASNYETNLTAFIADLRKDLNTPNMPFSIAKISIVPYWPFATSIRQAEDNVAAKMSNVGIIDANNYPRITTDPYHYTSTGLISMGNEFALSLHSIIQKKPIIF